MIRPPTEVKYPISYAPDDIPRMELDWREYFYRFCEAHGKWPVVHEGWLLFEDGWRYSATDYSGPEHPPPSDARAHLDLISIYKRRRLSIVKGQQQQLAAMLRGLKRLQQTKQQPIPQRLIEGLDSEGRAVSKVTDIDWQLMTARLDWLNKDVDRLERELRTIGG